MTSIKVNTIEKMLTISISSRLKIYDLKCLVIKYNNKNNNECKLITLSNQNVTRFIFQPFL